MDPSKVPADVDADDAFLVAGDDPLSQAAAAAATAAREASAKKPEKKTYYRPPSPPETYGTPPTASDVARPLESQPSEETLDRFETPPAELSARNSVVEAPASIPQNTNANQVARKSSTHPGGSSEYLASDGNDWARRKRNFFVLSTAGKPIYSRYGDEAELSSFMGLLQALFSFFASDGDQLLSVRAGGHRFVFQSRGPLYLVGVSSAGEDEAELGKQLEHLYAQIVFVLTGSQLTRIFEQRSNYDLRILLTGTDVFLDELCRSHTRGLAFSLQSLPCLKLRAGLRSIINTVLATGAPKTLLYALLLAKDKLIGAAKQKRFPLHSLDALLLINMVTASTSFRSAESWTPICLPTFHSGAFVHCYVCFLTSDMCLILISSDKDAFFDMSEFKTTVAESLDEKGVVDDIEEAIASDPYKLVELDVPRLRHFLCRPKGLSQFTEPHPLPPYTRKADYQRVMLHYQYAKRRLDSFEGPVKLTYHVGKDETVVLWTSISYEFFAAFGPLITKQAASTSLALLQKWVKQHDDELFVGNVVPFTPPA
ncbi:Vacuolar fusion protein mon1b [Phlyctochytrium bullatum]|nr:Vacuolar fusion protein mon1b [Phlyctochytrium bullatum]